MQEKLKPLFNKAINENWSITRLWGEIIKYLNENE